MLGTVVPLIAKGVGTLVYVGTYQELYQRVVVKRILGKLEASKDEEAYVFKNSQDFAFKFALAIAAAMGCALVALEAGSVVADGINARYGEKTEEPLLIEV